MRSKAATLRGDTRHRIAYNVLFYIIIILCPTAKGDLMPYKKVLISDLQVNRANDRHGELENETAAIAWLFNAREQHMRNLAKDIAEQGIVFEPPLVYSEGSKYIVYDGNRRVTCLKLLEDPKRAPTVELQEFFKTLRQGWSGAFPSAIECQVENDRDRIDDILYRRHTGAQSGVGQSNWDDRMKQTFVTRTGKGNGLNVADEIEKRLTDSGMLPGKKKIPRSTLNRLLSAEAFRNRLGFSVSKGRFEFTHDENVALGAMARVASDLANKVKVLGDLWDVDGKRGYLDELESEGVLPNASHAIKKKSGSTGGPTQPRPPRPTPAPRPKVRATLIPQVNFGLAWPGRLQRHHAIWDELQFKLNLHDHANAISVLFRVLLELSVENYIAQEKVSIQPNDKLHNKVAKVGADLLAKGKIDKKYADSFKKFSQSEQLISADTMNRYVHSPQFSPSPEHLRALWDSLSELIVQCLKV